MTTNKPKLNVKRPTINQPSDSSLRYIPCTRGQVATVDAADYDMLNQYNWTACGKTGNMYPATAIKGSSGKFTTISMHRLLLGLGKGELGDHINGDTFDVRRCNLRKATYGINAINRGTRKPNKVGVKGVYRSGANRFYSVITLDSVKYRLGTFDTIAEAAEAYRIASLRYHGEYARAA